MAGGGSDQRGPVTCGSWIRRPENASWVVFGRSRPKGSPFSSSSVLEIFSFDPKTTSHSSSPLTTYVLEEVEGDVVSIAVTGGSTVGSSGSHDPLETMETTLKLPYATSWSWGRRGRSGDDIVCSTSNGVCKLFELYGQESTAKLLAKELPPLEGIGPQKCLAFSVDGSKLATGGVDGHLRILEWPSLRIILDEPKAHNSVLDMDFSLDTEFLASTYTDGSARIWKLEDGVPLTTLTRNSDEKIELCRFSKDGTKPFLFCTVQKGDKAFTAVWDISTWSKIGHKRLLKKSASVMSVSKDGKYLALGSKDGDICVVEVKKMEICHWSKRLHLGTGIETLEFCPTERVVLSTSNQWGAVVTKLTVPADWKEWQIYLVLLGLFLASAVAFYIFFENSDSFWNFPLGRNQPARPQFGAFLRESPSSDDRNIWGPVDM